MTRSSALVVAGRGLAGLGLLAVEGAIAVAYYDRGTWWHYLLHQFIGWGLGLSVAGLLVVGLRRHVPAIAAMVLGQLVSIVPDLMFRFLRMPHEPSMDWWVGHISIHTGPSPLLVALAVLLLGGWGWLLAFRLPAPALVVCLAGPALLLVACLLARPLPTSLSQYPASSAVVVPRAAAVPTPPSRYVRLAR